MTIFLILLSLVALYVLWTNQVIQYAYYRVYNFALVSFIMGVEYGPKAVITYWFVRPGA
jgi:hypothetical protein